MTEKLTLSVDIQGIDKVQTLLELLAQYQDELPGPLRSTLEELADCDACELDVEAMMRAGHHPAYVFVDGVQVDEVCSINLILKRLKVFGSSDVYPSNCIVRAGSVTGPVVASW